MYRDDDLAIFSIDDFLLDEEDTEEIANLFVSAIEEQRKDSEEQHFLKDADVLPQLDLRVSFGLRQVGAHLFGTIWRQTKYELQILKAEKTSNLCDFPKEVGPCRGLQARFFFNSESGTCEPFAVRTQDYNHQCDCQLFFCFILVWRMRRQCQQFSNSQRVCQVTFDQLDKLSFNGWAWYLKKRLKKLCKKKTQFKSFR